MPSTLRSQQLTLELRTARKKLDGSWGKLQPLYLNRNKIPGLPDAADRKILSLIAGATPGGPWKWYATGITLQVPTTCEIPLSAADLLLPLLGATGRFRMRLDSESDLGEPLSWNGGRALGDPPGGARGDRWGLPSGWLVRRGEARQTEPVVLLESGLVISGGEVSHLVDPAALRWSRLLHPENTVRVPAADREALLESLLAAPDLPPLELPEAMRFEETRPVPRPRLRLRPPEEPRSWPRAGALLPL